MLDLTCVCFSSLPAVGKTLEGVIQHLCTYRQGQLLCGSMWIHLAILTAEKDNILHMLWAMEPFNFELRLTFCAEWIRHWIHFCHSPIPPIWQFFSKIVHVKKGCTAELTWLTCWWWLCLYHSYTVYEASSPRFFLAALEGLVRSPGEQLHGATVSQFFSWQEADASGGGLNLLQTCEDAQMVYAFDLCSKHLGADMQQATSTVAVCCDNRFHKPRVGKTWKNAKVIPA